MYETLFIKMIFITGIIGLVVINVAIMILLYRKIIAPAVTETKILQQRDRIENIAQCVNKLEDKRRAESRRVDHIENYLIGKDVAQGENFDRYKQRRDIMYFAKYNL